MSSVALLLLIFLCFSSLHACDSRVLGFNSDQHHNQIISSKIYHVAQVSTHVAQEAEKVQLLETSSQSKMLKPSIPVEEYQTPKEAKNNVETITPENCDGATTPTHKVPNVLLRIQLEIADGKSSSGRKITKSLAQPVELRPSIKEKGLIKGHDDQRSMLETAPHDTEEALDFKENDNVNDVVVMDYAQPHWKPPIHNKKP